MKSFGKTLSVKEDSNRLISSTESNWGALREGSFISVAKDKAVYHISKTEPLFYIKNFEKTEDNYKIVIAENTELNIMKDDVLSITYKEYELMTIFDVENGGRNFKIGDVLEAEGGAASDNTREGGKEKTRVEVVSVAAGGRIESLKINSKGSYLNSPEKICVFQKEGQQCILNVDWLEKPDRKMIEREVVFVFQEDNKTIINLNYPLPEKMKKGKLSVTKWVAWLTEKYSAETKINADYNVMRDFSANYKWPLLPINSPNQELIMTKVITRMDKKVKELEDRIFQLES